MQDPAVEHLTKVLLEDMRTHWSGALERFIVMLASDAGKKAYKEWSQDSVTRLFVGAITALAETCIHEYPDNDRGLALAHGCMSGLAMAARLMDDPTRVFPSIFDGADKLMGRKPAENLDTEYVAGPDGTPVKKEDNK